MNLYDDLVKAVEININNAAMSDNLSMTNAYVAIAQVQATLAVAESLRALAPKPKPTGLP